MKSARSSHGFGSALNVSEQLAQRLARDFFVRLRDSRQRRIGKGRIAIVSETDDRKLLRHRQAALASDPHGDHRQIIARAQKRRWRFGRVQQTMESLFHQLDVVPRSESRAVFVNGQTEFAQNFQRQFETAASQLGRGSRAQMSDAAVP